MLFVEVGVRKKNFTFLMQISQDFLRFTEEEFLEYPLRVWGKYNIIIIYVINVLSASIWVNAQQTQIVGGTSYFDPFVITQIIHASRPTKV